MYIYNYRYGFNGEMIEDEIAGEGMTYDLGERFYDGRIGRMFKRDPLESKYPWQSTYVYCGNNPITIVDLKGMGNGNQDGADKVKLNKGESPFALAEKYYNEYGKKMGYSKTEYMNKIKEWNKGARWWKGDNVYIEDPNAKSKMLLILPMVTLKSDNAGSDVKKPAPSHIDLLFNYSISKYSGTGKETNDGSIQAKTNPELPFYVATGVDLSKNAVYNSNTWFSFKSFSRTNTFGPNGGTNFGNGTLGSVNASKSFASSLETMSRGLTFIDIGNNYYQVSTGQQTFFQATANSTASVIFMKLPFPWNVVGSTSWEAGKHYSIIKLFK